MDELARDSVSIQLKLCLRGSAAGLLKECREESFDILVEKLRQRISARGRGSPPCRAQLNRLSVVNKAKDLQSLYIKRQ